MQGAQYTQINQARILYYDCFASLLVYELLLRHQEVLKSQINLLAQYPLQDEDVQTFEQLQTALNGDYEKIVSECVNVFSLPFALDGNKPIEPYLSHYQEGCIGGRSLVQVRDLLKDSSFCINKEITKENEDHFGLLCLFMKHLLQQEEYQKSEEVYYTCIAPMKNQFIGELKTLKGREFYCGVGKLLESFLILEDGIYGLI